MRTTHILSLLLLLCFGFSASVSAQSNLRRQADELFYKFAYAKAIPAYEKLALKDNHSHHAWQRLAECHLMLRDFEKALPYFERFINEDNLEPDYYFKYGMALKSAGREKEALQWFKRYKRLAKNDARIKRYLKEGNFASVLFNSRESKNNRRRPPAGG